MENNVLVTGGSGFVGRALIARLVLEGKNVVVVSRDKNFAYSGVTMLYGDLADEEFCKQIMSGIHDVYYLAAYKKNLAVHIRESFDVFLGNVLPFLHFLKVVKDSSVQNITYVSSVNAEYALTESVVDGYAIGKFVNELAIKTYIAQTKKSIKVIRSVGVYGPGDNFDPKTANFIPSTISKVYNSSDATISVWGSGERKMQFIFVEDFVSNIIKITETGGDSFYVVGNPEIITVNDLVKKVVVLSGKDMKIQNDLTKTDRSGQIFEFTNIVEPKFSIVDGLKKTIEYFNNLHV